MRTGAARTADGSYATAPPHVGIDEDEEQVFDVE
jgi:hypothetical protein